MIKIMFRHRNYGSWECIGSYYSLEDATKDLDRYKKGVLGETGTLRLVTEREEKYLYE